MRRTRARFYVKWRSRSLITRILYLGEITWLVNSELLYFRSVSWLITVQRIRTRPLCVWSWSLDSFLESRFFSISRNRKRYVSSSFFLESFKCSNDRKRGFVILTCVERWSFPCVPVISLKKRTQLNSVSYTRRSRLVNQWSVYDVSCNMSKSTSQ